MWIKGEFKLYQDLIMSDKFYFALLSLSTERLWTQSWEEEKEEKKKENYKEIQ